MIPLSEYIAALERRLAELPEAKLAVVKHHMEEGAKLAKSFIGNEGNGQGWAELAEVTIQDKQAKGYATPAPLLREGHLRDSYSGHAEAEGRLTVGVIGSSSEISKDQELGTSRIPPRPVSAGAMTETVPHLLHDLAELAVRTLSIR